MGSGAPGANPDYGSSDSSIDNDNLRPPKDASAKDWCRFYRRRERKQQADIRGFFSAEQPQQESCRKQAKYVPTLDSFEGYSKD